MSAKRWDFELVRSGDEWCLYRYRGILVRYIGVGCSGYYESGDWGAYLGYTEEDVRLKLDKRLQSKRRSPCTAKNSKPS